MGSRLRFGPYDVLFELASGGMGRVYVARKSGAGGFERLAVLKRVHSHLLSDPDVCAMVRDEAKIAALVVHPNVVGVEDVLDTGDELLLAQPYVESASLSDLLKAARKAGEKLSPAVAARITLDLLAGLHAAHEARDLRGELLHVVHRDVSPHNVLVGADGRARLIDFGIARAERRLTQTKSGVVKGKLAYVAPETLRNDPVDLRVDVFAAGIVLHEALSGQRLFDGDDEGAVLLAVMLQEDRAAVRADPGVPAEARSGGAPRAGARPRRSVFDRP
ncbi:MAG: serine/threonine-protein kinase [Polyangiaceae bacterium]